MDEFHTLVKKFGTELLEKLDDWLSLHEATDVDSTAIRTRVGIYFYKDELGDSEKWSITEEPTGKQR